MTTLLLLVVGVETEECYSLLLTLNLLRRHLRRDGLLPSIRHVHHGRGRANHHPPGQLRLFISTPSHDGQQWNDQVQAGPRQEEGQSQGQSCGE